MNLTPDCLTPSLQRLAETDHKNASKSELGFHESIEFRSRGLSIRGDADQLVGQPIAVLAASAIAYRVG